MNDVQNNKKNIPLNQGDLPNGVWGDDVDYSPVDTIAIPKINNDEQIPLNQGDLPNGTYGDDIDFSSNDAIDSSNDSANTETNQSTSSEQVPLNQGDLPNGNYGDDVDFSSNDVIDSSNDSTNTGTNQSTSEEQIPLNQGDLPNGNYGDDVDFNPSDVIEPSITTSGTETSQNSSDQTPVNQGDTANGNYGDDVDFNSSDVIEPSQSVESTQSNISAETNPEIAKNDEIIRTAYDELNELIRNRNKANVGDNRTINAMNEAIEEREKIIQEARRRNEEIMNNSNSIEPSLRGGRGIANPDPNRINFIPDSYDYENNYTHTQTPDNSSEVYVSPSNSQSNQTPVNQGDTANGNYGDDIDFNPSDVIEPSITTSNAETSQNSGDQTPVNQGDTANGNYGDDIDFNPWDNIPFSNNSTKNNEEIMIDTNSPGEKQLDSSKESIIDNPSLTNGEAQKYKSKKEIITIEGILYKIKHNENGKEEHEMYDVSSTQYNLYNMHKSKIFGPFYTSENRKNVLYTVAHIVPYGVQTVTNIVKKGIGSIFVARKTIKAVQTMEHRASLLSNEEMNVLQDQYLGSNVKSLNQSTAVNSILKTRIHEHRTKEISKMQKDYLDNYESLANNYKYIKAIEKELANPKLDEAKRAYYTEAKSTLSSTAGYCVANIIYLKNALDRDFSSGRHGQDEDLEKGSKDHMGGLFSRRAKQDGELLAAEAKYQQELISALDISGLSMEGITKITLISPENGLKAAEAFIEHQKVVKNATDIKNGIIGKASVGERDFVIVPEGLDYSNDMLVRDLLTTLMVVGTTLNAIQNAQTKAAIEASKSEAENINSQLDTTRTQLEDIKESGRETVTAQTKSLEAQMDKSTGIDVPNAIETAEMRKLGRFDNSLPSGYESHFERIANAAANKETITEIMSISDPVKRLEKLTSEFGNVITAEGKIQESFIKALKNYNDKTIINHPEWRLTEQIESLERFTSVGVQNIISASQKTAELLQGIENFTIPSLDSIELLTKLNQINISDLPNGLVIGGLFASSESPKVEDQTKADQKDMPSLESVETDKTELSNLNKKTIKEELIKARDFIKTHKDQNEAVIEEESQGRSI